MIEIAPITTRKEYMSLDNAKLYQLFFECNGKGWRFPLESEMEAFSYIPCSIGWIWTQEKIDNEEYILYDVILVRDI